MKIINRYRKWRANYLLEKFLDTLSSIPRPKRHKRVRRLFNLVRLRVQIDETIRCNLPPVNIEPFGFSSVVEIDEELNNLSSAEKLKVLQKLEERQRDIKSHIEKERKKYGINHTEVNQND